MKQKMIFLENRITLPRYNYLFFDSLNLEKILVYPSSEQGLMKSYIKHFDSAYCVKSLAENKYINVFDYSDLVEVIADISENPEDLIFVTSFELYIETVGKLNSYFKTCGPSYESFQNYRSKTKMKELLSSENIRVPKTLLFDKDKHKNFEAEYFADVMKSLNLPFIVKQSDGVSGLGVFKIDSETDFIDIQLNEKYDYDIEEYIDGDLYHVDFSIYDSSMIFFEVCQYSISHILMRNKKNKIIGGMPLEPKDILRTKIRSLSLDIVRTLGMLNGCYHLELFRNRKDELVFLEIASRPGGGFITKMYEKMYGIGLYEINLLVQSNNLELLKIPEKPYTYCFWVECLKTFQINVGFKCNSKISETKVSNVALVWDNNYQKLKEDFQKLIALE